MANKYIVIETNRDGEISFLFPQVVGHDDMCEMLKSRYPDLKVLSAGFWSINNGGDLIPYGSSVSLNVNSRPEDIYILNKDHNDGKIVLSDSSLKVGNDGK